MITKNPESNFVLQAGISCLNSFKYDTAHGILKLRNASFNEADDDVISHSLI